MAKSTQESSGRELDSLSKDTGYSQGNGSAGFPLGLGLGMFIGAVAGSLLTSQSGADFMGYLEERLSELKDKGKEMLQSSELKEKVGEVLRTKVVDKVSEVLTGAKEKVSEATETAASLVGMDSGEEDGKPEGGKPEGGKGREMAANGQSSRSEGNKSGGNKSHK